MTNDDKRRINELYKKYHTYTEVARQTGFTPATVKKYVIKDYVPDEERILIRFTPEQLPEFTGERFEGVENYGDLCILSEQEVNDIKELWKELAV